MKKYFFVLLTGAFAFPAAAANNCQARVDQHWDGTTAERVAYCLSEDEPEQAPAATEVLISDTYSVIYPAPKTKKKTQEQESQTTRRYHQQPISTEFLDQQHYPAFRNDTWPTINPSLAHEEVLELLRTANTQKDAGSVPTTKKAKPARKMKKVKEEVPAPQPADTQLTVTQPQVDYNDSLSPFNNAPYNYNEPTSDGLTRHSIDSSFEL